MIRTDLHVHTTYCDGKNTPEEVVLSAIEKGVERLGFSGHAYTSFDESYCMSVEGTKAYKREIAALKEKYKDKIEILLGVERDYYSDEARGGYDYVIGSVHYLFLGGEYSPIDESADSFRRLALGHFGGDYYALAEAYFDTLAGVVEKTNADIIGHFDLVCKYNEKYKLFDESHPRYVRARKACADELIKTGKYFEINTGGISRGYKTQPYPNEGMLRYLGKKGAKALLSSDSHRAETLLFGFEEWETKARAAGLTV